MNKCVVCRENAQPLFLCDREQGQWCLECFEEHVHCLEEHPEDCATVVWSM